MGEMYRQFKLTGVPHRPSGDGQADRSHRYTHARRQLVMTRSQSVSRCEQRSVGGRRSRRRGVNRCISQVGVYQKVHHRLGMDKYELFHIEAVFWHMASQFSRSPGTRAPFGGVEVQHSACGLWTGARSFHPQRRLLTSFAAAKFRWADRFPFKDSGD